MAAQLSNSHESHLLLLNFKLYLNAVRVEFWKIEVRSYVIKFLTSNFHRTKVWKSAALHVRSIRGTVIKWRINCEEGQVRAKLETIGLSNWRDGEIRNFSSCRTICVRCDVPNWTTTFLKVYTKLLRRPVIKMTQVCCFWIKLYRK